MSLSRPKKLCPECGKRMPPGFAIYCGRRCERSAQKYDPGMHRRRGRVRLLLCVVFGLWLVLQLIYGDKKDDQPTPSINAPTFAAPRNATVTTNPGQNKDLAETSTPGVTVSNAGSSTGHRENPGDSGASNCTLEAAPAIPDGATATLEQMKSAQAAIKNYGKDFRDCIDRSGGAKTAVAYARSLEMQSVLGAKFNDALRVFEAGHSTVSPDPPAAAQDAFASDAQRIGYAAGVTVGRALKKKNSSTDVDYLLAGIREQTTHEKHRQSKFRNRRERESYALGKRIGHKLSQGSLSVDINSFLEGVRDAFIGGILKLEDDEIAAAIQQLESGPGGI